MKPLRLQTVFFALLLALGTAGCTHKKPVAATPQQPPQAAAPEPSPTPEPAQPAAQPTEPQPTEQQPAPADDAKTSTAKPKTKNGTATARKPATPATGGQKPANEVAHNTPSKKVIPADKTEPKPPAGGQISPGPTPADASSQASTEQLLQSAESNLNGINRQLSKDEEAMKAQIKEFISQSRKATTENDPARAHNFAVKARLLSDELVRQR